ncbi:hypothetical protein BH10ACT8_BH10ACT8_11200 [soil metagenome]
MTSESHDIGSIVGYLRMDDSDWKRTIDEAKAKAAELGKSNPSVKVDVDSATAIRKITEVTAAIKAVGKEKVDFRIEVDGSLARVELAKLSIEAASLAVSFKHAQQNASKSIDDLGTSMQRGGSYFSKLRTAVTDTAHAVSRDGSNMLDTLKGVPIMAYGVAAGIAVIGPAAGVATAGMIGLAGAAAVAVLAYKGFQNQIAQGTPVGLQVQSSIKGISAELSHLEGVASSSAAGGVVGALGQIKAFLPTLDPIVGKLATHLGAALNTSTGALITGLKVASPLLDDAGKYAESLAQKVANFAASPEFKQFINYARQELPKVGKDLGDVGKAAIGVATTLQPIGDALLVIVDDAAKAVSAITKVINATVKLDTTGPSKPKGKQSTLGYLANVGETILFGQQGPHISKKSTAQAPAPPTIRPSLWNIRTGSTPPIRPRRPRPVSPPRPRSSTPRWSASPPTRSARARSARTSSTPPSSW